MSVDNKTKELFICSCTSTEHQIVFKYDKEEVYPIVYTEIHLSKLPFFHRLKYGLKYIFGYQCKYGAFDEFIFDKDDAKKLQIIVDYLNEKKG